MTDVQASYNGDHLQRAKAAWLMRIEGQPWHAIAQALGYSQPDSACRAVRTFVDRSPHPDGAEIRRELHERTEWLWHQAVRDVQDQRPGSVTAAVRVLDRWARLTGSDAPSRVVVGHVESLAAEMYEERAGDVPVLPSLPALCELKTAVE